MKANLTVSLDLELVEKLKRETNYSDLINTEMKAFYDVKTIENLEDLKQKQAKIKLFIKDNRKILREIDQKIDKISEKEKLFKKKLLSRDKMIQEIIKKRAEANKNTYRRIEFFETPEQEADRILKGGAR